MRPGAKSILRQKRLLWQVLIAFALLVFPVFMIFFNGKRALQGVFWQVPDELKQYNMPDEGGKEGSTNPRINVPEFGIYDPENKFAEDRNFTLEQFYTSWIDLDEIFIRQKIDLILSGGRTPVWTIEPWNGSNSEHALLTDITNGKYDSHLDRLYFILSGYGQKIYLIWGHEMDQDLTKRYPWSGKEPDEYIAAYRYVHDRLNTRLAGVEWIWSPVVKKGCERYWPGEAYVDFVGMPVYSFPEWEKNYYGYLRSFKSWYAEKYALLKDFGKPVVIVELGVTGSLDYQTYWLQEAFETIQSNTSIDKVIFFYARDTEGSWGENMATPDWRTNPETLTGLVTWINSLDD